MSLCVFSSRWQRVVQWCQKTFTHRGRGRGEGEDVEMGRCEGRIEVTAPNLEVVEADSGKCDGVESDDVKCDNEKCDGVGSDGVKSDCAESDSGGGDGKRVEEEEDKSVIHTSAEITSTLKDEEIEDKESMASSDSVEMM